MGILEEEISRKSPPVSLAKRGWELRGVAGDSIGIGRIKLRSYRNSNR